MSSKTRQREGHTKGGGKLQRSEIVQARLDQRQRFLASVLSRSHRRTVSNLLEMALEEYAKGMTVKMLPRDYIPIPTPHVSASYDHYEDVPLNHAMQGLWHLHEGVRLTNIAMCAPDLLDVEEAELWRVVLQNAYFWAHYRATIVDGKGKPIKKVWMPIISPMGLSPVPLIEEWDGIVNSVKHMSETSSYCAKTDIPRTLGAIINCPKGWPSEISELDFNASVSGCGGYIHEEDNVRMLNEDEE